MHFSHLLLLAGTALAVAFPSADPGCCCCDVSQNAIVCNPDIPFSDCICTLAKCPDDAPTITQVPTTPTPPPSYSEVEEKRVESTPLPPPGKEWCCCCNGKDYVCVARPKGEGCFCPAIACPEDAKTIYPSTRLGRSDRPGRPSV
ncbi:hypothetical protein NLU13_2662 [Sarocladium strictum]|uniref:Extracellular membrane protein CFEM domain-containing protein n=1 Tax=Sarocladium strictum TaxID=5046 RepID=A0AA39L917_SARSR|nr:hypothetical protein NLU13_2662 [Sarocladium strictum]